jgi:hypothetical protein
MLTRSGIIDRSLENIKESLAYLDDLLADMEGNRNAIRDCDHDKLELAICHVVSAARSRHIELLKEKLKALESEIGEVG